MLVPSAMYGTTRGAHPIERQLGARNSAIHAQLLMLLAAMALGCAASMCIARTFLMGTSELPSTHLHDMLPRTGKDGLSAASSRTNDDVGHRFFKETAVSSRPRTLLLIPLHTSQPEQHVEDFAACMFGHAPSLSGEAFDILLSWSGTYAPSDADVGIAVGALGRATRDIAPRVPSIYTTFTELSDDHYDLDGSGGRKASFSGPNAAFYANLLQGKPYDLHARHYAFVQQLETDCCSMSPGWLDAMLAPVLADADVLVSGGRLNASCQHDDVDGLRGACQPLETNPE